MKHLVRTSKNLGHAIREARKAKNLTLNIDNPNLMAQTMAYRGANGADVVELVYTTDLKSVASTMAYEFESRRPHQPKADLKSSLDCLRQRIYPKNPNKITHKENVSTLYDRLQR